MERRYALASAGIDLEKLLHIVGELLSIDPSIIPGPSKRRDIVKARSLACYWASSELGLTMSELAKLMT